MKKFSELIEKCVDTKINSALAPVIEKHNDLENKTSKAIVDLSQEVASLKQLVEIKILPSHKQNHYTNLLLHNQVLPLLIPGPFPHMSPSLPRYITPLMLQSALVHSLSRDLKPVA